ncbi:MAG: PAS domain-containing protein [Burkholderiaceae bacterium]|nr:PAS domain-containing protein [Burkholderiaceae bacterium]MDO9090951.1 PAS domain-containing protein [Burkholderiaceae bacterium]
MSVLGEKLDANDEVAALVEVLRVTDRRLDKLLGGEIDTLTDREGGTILLRRAQGFLRQSDASRQASILGALPASIALLDSRGVILFVNTAWTTFAKGNGLRTRDDGVGLNYLDFCHDAGHIDGPEIAAIGAGLRSVLSGEAQSYSAEYPCHSPTQQRWFKLRVAPVADGLQTGAVVMHIDITESRLAAISKAAVACQTERRERMLSTMLSSITDFAYVFDRQGRFLFVNQPLLDLLGITLEQATGKNFSELGYPPALARRLQRQIEDVYVFGKSITGETPYVSPMGKEGYYEYIFSPALSAGGDVDFVVGATRDITERKLAESALLELNSSLEARVRQRTAELEAANAELEFFSYSIAHDLRGPLATIEGFGALLESQAATELSERSRHYVTRMRSGVRHMELLTDGLLALARLSRAAVINEPVDLADIARSFVAVLREGAPGRNVTVIIPPSMPAQGDPRLLTQVLSNLLGNAWKFTGKTPEAVIEVGMVPAAEGESPTYFVRDNGAGFDMAYASKMFKPFERLHSREQFEGTGIGLALVQKIVALHAGRIWAKSQTGKGATFSFTLGKISIA